MARMLTVAAVLALLASGAVVFLSALEVLRHESATEGFQTTSLVERFRQRARSREHQPLTSPLVEQAKIFALILDPPKLAQPRIAPKRVTARKQTVRTAPAISPAVSVPKFRLQGVSFYPSHPEKSMALIAEVGQSSEARWVKEGDRWGHFVIHEIRRGIVVCRSAEQLHEVVVERGTGLRSLVRNVGTETRKVGAVLGDRETLSGEVLTPSVIPRNR